MQSSTSGLPEHLSAALDQFRAKLHARRSVADIYPEVLRGLSTLPPALLGRAEPEIIWQAGITWYGPSPIIVQRTLGIAPREQLAQVPGLEFLFLLHRDGHLREKALHKLQGPIPSPSLFVLLAWRLNDWVPQVRAAATECAARTFPLTSPDVIVGAAAALLTRNQTWRRWGEERAQLTTAFDRPDVAVALARHIARQTTGPLPTILRAALRGPSMDAQLPLLAREAIQPAVRAVAVQALIDGFASWPAGWKWRWIEKPMGIKRAETVFAQRQLTVATDPRAMILEGLADRSAMVRNVAIGGLIRHRDAFPDSRELAAPFLHDRSAPVREKAAFLLR